MRTALASILCVTAALGATLPQRGPAPPPSPPPHFGLGLTEGAVGFEATLEAALSARADFAELPQQWDEVETAPGTYEVALLDAVNTAYAGAGFAVALSLNPIDTSTRRVPAHLADLPLDDPRVVEAFVAFVDHVLAHLPDVELHSIVVGNEIDALLGTDRDAWNEYARFLAAVRPHVARIAPGVPFGTKMTWAVRSPKLRRRARPVLAASDACFLTYYPLDDALQVLPPAAVERHIEVLVDVAGEKPLHLLEAGYPSASANGSSLERQAAFVDHLFDAWENHAKGLRTLNVVWLHDLEASQVEALCAYYGAENEAFAGFLGSLGLRTHGGDAKPAWERLVARRSRAPKDR